MKTLIFDFDGTLADTQQGICQCVNATLTRTGHQALDEAAITPLIGLPLEQMFVIFTGNDDPRAAEHLSAVYRELYDDIAPLTLRLFPGVAETLVRLREQGMLLCVASSKGHDALDLQLLQTGIADLFSTVVTGHDVAHSKPAPDMVMLALRNIGRTVEGAMVIGDTEYDIAMGRSAGCLTCGVTYGNHSAERLHAAGADYLISSFRELADICI